MSRIHDIFLSRLAPEERARYDEAVETGVCWNVGCRKPVYQLFKTSPAYQCARCGIENLARGIEAEWEGDSLKEIHEGEQLGALIRGRCGIRP